MTQSLFVGVDGGATKCIVCVEDQSGKLLGREISGPGNIRISVKQTWDSINSALKKILQPLGITLEDKGIDWQVGMGLAGCELSSAREAFLAEPHPFKTLLLSSDAHTACLGAHAGRDGAIIIIGTGVVGFQVQNNQIAKVSGWGFPQDDEGGGAWIGLQAAKMTLQALDGRIPFGNISELVMKKFENNKESFIAWTNQANSTAFAELAPLVVQLAKVNDKQALDIMHEAAAAINLVFEALQKNQPDPKTILPLSLIGGIAPFIQPFLNTKLQERLTPCQLTPDQGAIILVKGKKND